MRRKQESFGEQNVSLTRLEYQVNYRAVIHEQRERRVLIRNKIVFYPESIGGVMEIVLKELHNHTGILERFLLLQG